MGAWNHSEWNHVESGFSTKLESLRMERLRMESHIMERLRMERRRKTFSPNWGADLASGEPLACRGTRPGGIQSGQGLPHLQGQGDGARGPSVLSAGVDPAGHVKDFGEVGQG
jgi:hypothetical protein